MHWIQRANNHYLVDRHHPKPMHNIASVCAYSYGGFNVRFRGMQIGEVFTWEQGKQLVENALAKDLQEIKEFLEGDR